MRGYTAKTAHRRSGIFPYVELWKQPLWRWIVAWLYGQWESLSWPFMKHFLDGWHRKYFGKNSLDYIPLSNRQDIRCDHLRHAGRETIAIAYITKEQYDVITGKAPKTTKLRHEAKEALPEPEGIESYQEE